MLAIPRVIYNTLLPNLSTQSTSSLFSNPKSQRPLLILTVAKGSLTFPCAIGHLLTSSTSRIRQGPFPPPPPPPPPPPAKPFYHKPLNLSHEITPFLLSQMQPFVVSSTSISNDLASRANLALPPLFLEREIDFFFLSDIELLIITIAHMFKAKCHGRRFFLTTYVRLSQQYSNLAC